jgi:hypothetical protein
MYGTHSIDDLLATTTTVQDYGMDALFEQYEQYLAAHNAVMQELITQHCEITTDRKRRYGDSATKTFSRGDEFAVPLAQKTPNPTGIDLGFPMYLHQMASQWTRRYLRRRTVAEVTRELVATRDADVRNVTAEIKRAYFTPTNATVRDLLVDKTNIPVKALLNADGGSIPLGPNGEVFDPATHTHYLFTAAFVAGNLTSLVDTIVEHNAAGGVMVYINRAQESTVTGFAGFNKYIGANIVNVTGQYNDARELNQMNPNNRPIGEYNGAEIWTKPWIPAGYALAFNTSQPALAFRVEDGFSDLEIAAEFEGYPLIAQFIERMFGVGVAQRHNAAILYIGGGAYVTPTIVA